MSTTKKPSTTAASKRTKAPSPTQKPRRTRPRAAASEQIAKLQERLRADDLTLSRGLDALLRHEPFVRLSGAARLAIRKCASQSLAVAARRVAVAKNAAAKPNPGKLAARPYKHTGADVLLKVGARLPATARTGA